MHRHPQGADHTRPIAPNFDTRLEPSHVVPAQEALRGFRALTNALEGSFENHCPICPRLYTVLVQLRGLNSCREEFAAMAAGGPPERCGR